MTVVQYKSARQVTTDILTEISARTGITDANLGSVIRTLAYAFGVEVAAYYLQLYFAQKGYYIREATGEYLDNRAADFGLTREAARKAIGFVTFTGTPASSIPLGAQIRKPATAVTDAVVFETTESGVVPGGGSIVLAVQAVVAGENGNVAAASITEQVTTIAGITAVSNAAQTRLGRDEEDNASLRERILRHLDGLSRGTVPSIRRGALDFRVQTLTLNGPLASADTELAVDEDLNLVPIATSGDIWIGTEEASYAGIDTSATPHKLTGLTRPSAADWPDATVVKEYVPAGSAEYVQSASISETLGQVDIYLDDGSTAGISAELTELVEGRLRGDGTERNPGYKAAGTMLYAHAASLVTITVAAVITVADGYVPSAVYADAKDRVIRMINALGVGKTVHAYKVAATIQETAGVKTLNSLTVNSVAFAGTLSADVSVAGTAVARASSGSVGIS
jgi:uncharacterized phage protein gp47/JayE